MNQAEKVRKILEARLKGYGRPLNKKDVAGNPLYVGALVFSLDGNSGGPRYLTPCIVLRETPKMLKLHPLQHRYAAENKDPDKVILTSSLDIPEDVKYRAWSPHQRRAIDYSSEFFYVLTELDNFLREQEQAA